MHLLADAAMTWSEAIANIGLGFAIVLIMLILRP